MGLMRSNGRAFCGTSLSRYRPCHAELFHRVPTYDEGHLRQAVSAAITAGWVLHFPPGVGPNDSNRDFYW